MPSKKKENKVKILGVSIDSTSMGEVLRKISQRITKGKKTVIFTPNPEFLVFAKENPWFRQILNSADILLPDGIGLIWAAKLLGKTLRYRVAGADLVEELLSLASERGWRVGIIGARGGVASERKRQLEILRKKYRGAKIFSLEETPDWEKEKWEIILSCQGMGKQELWIAKNFDKASSLVFIGVGGSLDYLTGFVPRAPFFIRKMGFEWFFRLLIQPWRWRRQLSLVRFILMIISLKYRRQRVVLNYF
jgi:N-acetylglucosaminyldiphosphoundecaprenol N-acetyl-beta-D-mannosaminyltransferase